MNKPELGTKCTCATCNERFYDLNRSPAICPKCNTQQAVEKPRAPQPLRTAIEHRRFYRQPAPPVADEEVQPASTTENEEEAAETEHEFDEAIEFEPDPEEARA